MKTKKQLFDSFFNRILFAGFILVLINVAFYLLLKHTASPFVSAFHDGIIKTKLSDPGGGYILIHVLSLMVVFIIISMSKILWISRLENQNSQEEFLIFLLMNFIIAYIVFSGIFGIDPFGPELKKYSLGYTLRVRYSILAGLASVLFIKIRSSSDPTKVIIKYSGYLFFTLLLFGMLNIGAQGEFRSSGLYVEGDRFFEVLSLYPFIGLGSLAIVESIILRIETS